MDTQDEYDKMPVTLENFIKLKQKKEVLEKAIEKDSKLH